MIMKDFLGPGESVIPSVETLVRVETAIAALK